MDVGLEVPNCSLAATTELSSGQVELCKWDKLVWTLVCWLAIGAEGHIMWYQLYVPQQFLSEPRVRACGCNSTVATRYSVMIWLQHSPQPIGLPATSGYRVSLVSV